MTTRRFAGGNVFVGRPFQAEADSLERPSYYPLCAVGLLLAVLLTGCSPRASDSTDGRPVVFVGLPPLAYLAERIGGEYVDVQVLLPPGQDPHTAGFTSKQIAALSRAQLFVKSGMPFEDQIVGKLAAGSRGPLVVDVTQGIQKRPIDAPCIADEHDHDAECDHGGTAPDPHVWLSPLLLKTQAENITAALERVDPAHVEDYRRNLAALLADLDAIHARTAAALKPYRGQRFYVFHPAFGYFADAYGLRQEAVEAGGKSPGQKQLTALIEKAREDGVKIIFVQPQFDQRTAETVAKEIGGRVLSIDPLAKDVLANFADIADKIAQGL